MQMTIIRAYLCAPIVEPYRAEDLYFKSLARDTRWPLSRQGRRASTRLLAMHSTSTMTPLHVQAYLAAHHKNWKAICDIHIFQSDSFVPQYVSGRFYHLWVKVLQLLSGFLDSEETVLEFAARNVWIEHSKVWFIVRYRGLDYWKVTSITRGILIKLE